MVVFMNMKQLHTFLHDNGNILISYIKFMVVFMNMKQLHTRLIHTKVYMLLFIERTNIE